MAKNVISTDGSYEIKYTVPTGGVTSGSLVVSQKMAFVALETGSAGDVVDAMVGGAVVLPKAANLAVTQFAKTYYGAATGGTYKVANSGTTGKCIGFYLESATTGATKLTAKVRLIAGPMYAT